MSASVFNSACSQPPSVCHLDLALAVGWPGSEWTTGQNRLPGPGSWVTLSSKAVDGCFFVTGCCADAILTAPCPAPHDDGEEGVGRRERVAAKPLLVAVATLRND